MYYAEILSKLRHGPARGRKVLPRLRAKAGRRAATASPTQFCSPRRSPRCSAGPRSVLSNFCSRAERSAPAAGCSGPQPNQGSWQAAPAQQSYNAAQQSYNTAQQGYNAAQQGYRQPWQGYNQGQGAAQSPVPPQAYPQAVPKSGKSKLPLIVIAVVAVLALAAVAAFVWPGFLKSSAPAPSAPVTEPANPADPTASTAATAATQTAVPTDAPVTTEAPVIGNPFTNVDEDDPHYGEYLWCYSQGIYPESSIDREAVLDRGNVITLLWRAAGSPAPQGTAQASRT